MGKRISCIFLCVSIVALFLISTEANSQTKDKPVILKAVTPFPKTNMGIVCCVPLFVEGVNKRAQGRLKIDWLGGPEVIASFDQILSLKSGAIDMLLHYPYGYLVSLMPEGRAKGLSELCEWEERKSGAFELWSEIFEKKANAKYLGRLHSKAFMYVFSNRKVDKVADFKGLKIRTMPLYTSFIKALGAIPVTTAPTDIYFSMERGVVDAFLYSKIGSTSWGVQEVTKYIIEPGVFQLEAATMINLDSWKKIPNDLQEMLMEFIQYHEYIGSMQGQMIEEKEHRVWEKAGAKIVKLPPEEAEKFIKLAHDSVWEDVIKDAPEYGPKLRRAMSKTAVPKGAFPW